MIWDKLHNLRYADDTALMAESKEKLKSPLMRVKEESEKPGLKLNIQKTKIMASGSITSWQIDGEKMETAADFIFLGFPGGSAGKESTCNAGDPGSIPGSGRLPWRSDRLPTPVLLPGKSHARRTLVGCSPWGHEESDTTEKT